MKAERERSTVSEQWVIKWVIIVESVWFQREGGEGRGGKQILLRCTVVVGTEGGKERESERKRRSYYNSNDVLVSVVCFLRLPPLEA